MDLRSLIYNPKTIARILTKAPPLESFMMDLVYPEASRSTHPFSVLGAEDLEDVVSNVPLVRRDGVSYPLGAGGKGVKYIEPNPVSTSSFLSASKLNDLSALGMAAQQAYHTRLINKQRRASRSTAEALAVQSITGKISYPIMTAGGVMETYEVDFGSILSHTMGTKWDDNSCTLAQVLLDLIALGKAIKTTSGYGSKIVYLAGETAFVKLAEMVLNVGAAKIKAEITEHGIMLGKFMIRLASGGYKNLNDNTWVPAVADHQIVAIALDAPFSFFYCALDDLDASLVALPFFSKAIKQDDPSGYKIKGMSKPMPVPVVEAICAADATTPPAS